MTAGSGIVVGVDPSLTSTGIVQLHHGAPVSANCFGRSLHTRASYPARAQRMTYTAGAALRAIPADAELVVIEGMSYGSVGKYTDPDTFGLWWLLVTNLLGNPSWSVPLVVIPPSTLKVWVTGREAGGRADKTEILEVASSWWPQLTMRTHDVADAAGCATLGAAQLCHPLPFRLGRRHVETLYKIAWPDALNCPDCEHSPNETQGARCMAIVKHNGRRDYCGCRTLAGRRPIA